MNQLFSGLKNLMVALIIGAFAITLMLVFQAWAGQSNGLTTQFSPLLLLPSTGTYVVPTPNRTYVSRGTLIPRPDRYGTSPAILPIAVTPMSISETIDLSPTLPTDEKATALVRRPNGTYRAFLIPYNMDTKNLPLSAGDIVESVVPPRALMGIHMYLPTVSSPLATPTILTPMLGTNP